MDVLIILRPEIFSVFMMAFLIVYDRYCAKYRRGSHKFIKYAGICLAHDIMALVTEITVNVKGVPVVVNNLCHILFFVTALLYSLFYLHYALSLILPNGRRRKWFTVVSSVLSVVAMIVMFVSPIEYVSGSVTSYSAGVGASLCYALGFFYFILADIILIVNQRHIKSAIVWVLIPFSSVTVGLLLLQVLLPEFLYSAESLTLLTVGIFLAIENPFGKMKDKAFVDLNVQTWNRNAYEFDLTHGIKEMMEKSSGYECVMVDINGLKKLNDTMGHLEGDRLIENVAKVMMENMKNAYKVYRMGGDEFMVLYFDVDVSEIEAELDEVSIKCSEFHMGENIPVGVSVGRASGCGEDLNDAYRRAEKLMYENKQKYYQASGFVRRQV